MPRLEVKLIGSGTDVDPWRVALPTYTMVKVDYAGKRALVDVPDNIFPSTLPIAPKAVAYDGGKQHDVVTFNTQSRTRIRDYVQSNYVEGFKAWDTAEIE